MFVCFVDGKLLNSGIYAAVSPPIGERDSRFFERVRKRKASGADYSLNYFQTRRNSVILGGWMDASGLIGAAAPIVAFPIIA